MYTQKSFGCQNLNQNELYNSSSGGIFVLLAKKVLSRGGVIYGAAFDEDFNIVHIRIDRKDDLNQLMGSKYAYSIVGKSFSQCKDDLEQGKYVMFVGTPCQISGLRKLVGHNNNLVLVDFVCHGTPTNMYWKKYLDEISEGRTIKNVSFRDKRNGWNNYEFCVQFADGTSLRHNHLDDLYMKGFLYNLTLRESCFRCKYKDLFNKSSDITLGDLWGASALSSDFTDNKGMSLVIINSSIGDDLFMSIVGEMRYSYIELKDMIKNNSALTKSAKKNYFYNSFNEEYKQSKHISSTLKRYTNSSWRVLINRLYWKLCSNQKG